MARKIVIFDSYGICQYESDWSVAAGQSVRRVRGSYSALSDLSRIVCGTHFRGTCLVCELGTSQNYKIRPQNIAWRPLKGRGVYSMPVHEAMERKGVSMAECENRDTEERTPYLMPKMQCPD